MKNQYVGDIGDFGKYSLLQAFCEAGVVVGVNWYHTKDDGSSDGRFTDYLKQDVMSGYNPKLFNDLRKIAFLPDGTPNQKKTVEDIRSAGILPGAVFFSESLYSENTPLERWIRREKWFEKSKEMLKNAELVYLDPDNGLKVQKANSKRTDSTRKDAVKYVLPNEIVQYFRAGKNVVYYCHKGRRTPEQWAQYKKTMYEELLDAYPIILTFRRGTQRSYIFLIHEKENEKYRTIIDRFLQEWAKADDQIKRQHSSFCEESVEISDRKTIEFKKTPITSRRMGDRQFTVYWENGVFLGGEIKEGRLSLESQVLGEEYDSEKQYSFSEEDTKRLFSIIEFNAFIDSCRSGRLIWLEQFLEDNDIHPETFCYVN